MRRGRTLRGDTDGGCIRQSGRKWTWQRPSLPRSSSHRCGARVALGLEAAALLRSRRLARARACRTATAARVLLIPGFLAGDGSLATMTHWLRDERLPHAAAPGSARTSTARRRPARGSRSGSRRSPSATGERVVDHRPEPRRRVRPRARRAPPGPRVRASSRSARRPSRSSRVHPLVLAQVGVVGALGSGRVPGMFSCAACAATAASAFRAALAGAVPARGRLRLALLALGRHRRLARLPGPGAPSCVEVHASHCGMSVNAEVYRGDRPRAAALHRRRRDGLGAGRLARRVDPGRDGVVALRADGDARARCAAPRPRRRASSACAKSQRGAQPSSSRARALT